MTTVDIANSFFNSYASAATATTESGRVEAYQGMHQYLNENITFSDMAYDNIKSKRGFVIWHWFCLTIKDGKIADHKDEADIIKWAKQAKGDVVAMIAWTPLFKMALRRKTKKLLGAFIRDNPIYKD